jgi:adenylate cyclase
MVGEGVDERERLASLLSYGVLDTPSEFDYDDLTELAARLCRTPVAYVKFFDDKRAWFKSHVGFPPDLKEVPREATICNWTLSQSDLVVIPDCSDDERFRDNPTVVGWPNIRFYCGMPIINPDGYALGTFCVLDFVRRDDFTYEQQEVLRTLARQVMSHLERRRMSNRLSQALLDLERTKREAEEERVRADGLLCDILPRSIADELKANGQVRPRHFPLVSVLFGDFYGFTRLAARLEPAVLVQTLDCYFAAFDDAVDRHGLEKIKTIGDSYMCAGGLPLPSRSHVVDSCLAALQMQASVGRLNRERETFDQEAWRMRIGLHAGPVMAGVVGRRKFTYDIWGDVVNIAQRMEEAGEPGRINISEAVHHRVSRLFDCEPRGLCEVRGKGAMPMFFLNRIRPELSADAGGLEPNERFKLERQRV